MSWYKRLIFIISKIIWYIKFARHIPGRLIKLERSHRRLVAYIASNHTEIVSENIIHKSAINTKEFSVYSQNGEDGILLYIFSVIGTTNRMFVEFGIGDGQECNAANLIINFGWTGLLMDLMPKYVEAARNFYNLMLGENADRVKITQAQVAPHNINTLLQQHNIPKDIDLLSIDIDSNDYWVWEAISVLNPRVVVMEYNASFGAKKSITVKYKEEFNRFKFHPSGYYHGASLLALTKLASRKGYSLVGCDLSGVNAFFIRTDIAQGKFPVLTPQEAFYPLYKREELMTQENQFKLIASLEFEEV